MSDMKATIDGIEIDIDKEMTILEAAKQVGIEIPSLCYHEELSLHGGCRICVVEIEGVNRLVGSCHTPIAKGMVISTKSPKVMAARKATVELLFAGHTGPCVTDGRADQCELHKIASDIEVGPPRFMMKAPRFYPVEAVSPYVRRDMSKCILCSRCIRACREIAGQNIYSMAYRGFDSKVVVDNDKPLDKEVCKDCGICIEYCPTSALGWAEGAEKTVKKGKTAPAPFPASPKLFTALKQEQKSNGYISQKALETISADLAIPMSQVYGVATFYSFLAVEPQGRHVIKLCKSLSCFLKGGSMVLEALERTLKIQPGQTTSDGRFTLTMANCIGGCDQSPAMLIDDDFHGNLTSEKIVEILRSYE